jgi:hypothetical protein
VATETGWTISITGALRAHFKQPRGPSKPGADWSVALTRQGRTSRLMVRVYAEDVTGYTPEEEAKAVARYVNGLLQSGWSPETYQGAPSELTFPLPPLSAAVVAAHAKRPWWRFW